MQGHTVLFISNEDLNKPAEKAANGMIYKKLLHRLESMLYWNMYITLLGAQIICKIFLNFAVF